jgi:hypothetical protein
MPQSVTSRWTGTCAARCRSTACEVHAPQAHDTMARRGPSQQAMSCGASARSASDQQPGVALPYTVSRDTTYVRLGPRDGTDAWHMEAARTRRMTSPHKKCRRGPLPGIQVLLEVLSEEQGRCTTKAFLVGQRLRVHRLMVRPWQRRRARVQRWGSDTLRMGSACRFKGWRCACYTSRTPAPERPSWAGAV